MSAVYRYYCPEVDGALHAGDWVDADSDEAAIALITARHPGTHCEIWQGSRLVASVDDCPATHVGAKRAKPR